MQSKKRGHLQQFGIIHLLNPDLIYIRNFERNKIMFVPFNLLKTYIKNPSLFFISFFTLPPRAKPCARRKVSFAKFLFLISWFVKLLEINFSYFAKIRWKTRVA
jgi:hypothetical protein